MLRIVLFHENGNNIFFLISPSIFGPPGVFLPAIQDRALAPRAPTDPIKKRYEISFLFCDDSFEGLCSVNLLSLLQARRVLQRIPSSQHHFRLRGQFRVR